MRRLRALPDPTIAPFALPVTIASVAIRIAAVALLVLGPWADQPGELDGWDVARFQAMADADGRHWVDEPVEYPPGSVIVIEALAVGDVVATHRLLALACLAVDLGTAAALARWWRRRTGVAYLLLGLPLVPMGLVRLDLLATGLAVVAVAALVRERPRLAALVTVAGAMVKIWPALVVAAAVASGRWRAVAWTAVIGGIAGVGWIAYGGWSLDPLDQVLSLRGATGWHIESVAGSLTALLTDAVPERQLDAFRIGTLDERLVLAGRFLTVATVAALTLAGRRLTAGAPGGHRSGGVATPGAGTIPDSLVVAAVLLGSTAALIVTAPLLSPQFVLWLTPWAAIVATSAVPTGTTGRPGPVVGATALAAVLTGAVLAGFGPPRLHQPVPALLLLARDGLLVAVAGLSLRLLLGPVRAPGHAPEGAG